ncbi:DUF5602 domain-containing protein [Christiangramia forsetii]|uniref:Uncharacterized protein n=2 Tax=Christiangramia forsetii TaxID=411153 RepID=A0M6Z2_CHRFK|nr:DUF5602 domain-containing protein [Christiangramia forsetii]GGG29121.1 hypothetical protein GCM10011532_10760 [Christiangramia forsetii]CAL68387.1 conserved hypothetical protein, secreted [Christiangramia forsetii KT0803]
MMKKSSFHVTLQIALFSFIIISFTSCEQENIPTQDLEINTSNLKAERSKPVEKVNDFYGSAQPIGNGVARSYVSINHEGEPVSIGVLFSEKALENLGNEALNLTLELHSKARGLIVNHIDFGYNPMGHPGPVFMQEHFDIHFYWISVEEKLSIPFMVDDGEALDLPHSSTWPSNYEYEPATIPEMGRHWISEEQIHSDTFDETFIYGSYNSQFTFYEPMITTEYLQAKDFEDSYVITPLGAYEKPGYYSNSYKIMYDEVKKQYRVELTDMFWEDGL